MNSLFKLAITSSLAVPILWTFPSSAQPACTNGGIAYLTSLSAGCRSGDKVYSNFVFSPNWSMDTSIFGFTDNNNQHTFSGSGLSLTPGTYTYSYKIAISPAGSNEFMSYRTGAASSSIDPLVSTKTLIGSPDGVSVVAVNTSTSPTYTYASTASGPIDFTSTINVTSGRLDTITDSVYQANITTTAAAPAPLPILGVAAAFGSIRKLRQLSTSLNLTM
jgi:hypothetical protein